jgi:catechol 2,3-dioxygenase-like lactoylglutathione lyase family enzyme
MTPPPRFHITDAAASLAPHRSAAQQEYSNGGCLEERTITMATLGKLMGFIPTRNGDGVRDFYEGKLGLRFIMDDQFALVFESGDNMIRIARVNDFTPMRFTILGWESSDIEQDVRDLTARGITFDRYGFIPQDDLGIWTSPTAAKVAWFKDPDGNTLSLSQHV